MDESLFQNSPTGTLVAISGNDRFGTPWRHLAFQPNPLPADSPELSGAAYLRVADARAALASLDATARQLPNPRLFRHQSLRVEAQSTAALEGTYEPLDRVLTAAEDEPHDESMREVLNYIDVANEAYQHVAEGRPVNLSLLEELQSRLMRGTRSEREYSGRIRPIQVVIGRRDDADPTEPEIKASRYVPPPPGLDLEASVRDLTKWLATDHTGRIDPVVAAALAHYQFEALHPFHDGNGRLGRLLIVVSLHRAGLLSEPTLTVSPWFEARRPRYYDALLGVSTDGDWSTWVGFFAEGLAHSASQTQARMLDVSAAQEALKATIRASRIRTANAYHLVDFAVDRLIFTASEAAHQLGMKHQGAMKLIDSLISLGVLAPVDDRSYNRLFFAPRIIEVVLGRRGPVQG